MTHAADISVISVAYNSADALPGMLASLPAGQDVVIVDNGPDDGMRALVTDWGGRVVVPGENLGFGGGCNLGASQARGSYFLFLNPDARLREDTLAALVDAVDRHPGAGAFGACLVSETGKRSYRRRTRVGTGTPSLPKSVPVHDTQVPVLSGAALLVSRAAFERVGGFDPAMFLYYEDDDLTLRLSREIGPLWFIPQAEVLHIGGASSPTTPQMARFKGYHWGRSRVYAARKHGNRMPLWRGLRNALNFLISRRSLTSAVHRAEGTGRLAGAWSMRKKGMKDNEYE